MGEPEIPGRQPSQVDERVLGWAAEAEEMIAEDRREDPFITEITQYDDTPEKLWLNESWSFHKMPSNPAELRGWAENEADLIAMKLTHDIRRGKLAVPVDIDRLSEAERSLQFPLVLRDVQARGPEKFEKPDETAIKVFLDAQEEVNRTGTFDMRGAAGQMWQREKDTNEETRAGYALAGKSFAAKRAYRNDWIEKKISGDTIKSKTQTTTLKKTDEEIGDYLTPMAILARIGAGRSGVRALRSYVHMAMIVGGRWISYSS